jgi:hypothetical protein
MYIIDTLQLVGTKNVSNVIKNERNRKFREKKSTMLTAFGVGYNRFVTTVCILCPVAIQA